MLGGRAAPAQAASEEAVVHPHFENVILVEYSVVITTEQSSLVVVTVRLAAPVQVRCHTHTQSVIVALTPTCILMLVPLGGGNGRLISMSPWASAVSVTHVKLQGPTV